MPTIDDIRRDREAREQRAVERAAKIPPGDYHANGNTVARYVGGGVIETIVVCESHSDAVMVLVRINQ